jgi:23S rRNA (adenine2503-C2)-methyltransferase
VTVSGVGEPLHNAENVRAFIAHCREMGVRPSLTTSGGPLRHLVRFLSEVPHNGLTLSVHAGTEATRAELVPKGPSLAQLFGTLHDAVPKLGRNRRKRTALAYLMVDGVNDTERELDAFAERVRPLDLPVHLYALNPVPTSAHRAVSRARYEAAYRQLTGQGLRVRMSSKARLEANGGCGTLVALGRRRTAAATAETAGG